MPSTYKVELSIIVGWQLGATEVRYELSVCELSPPIINDRVQTQVSTYSTEHFTI